VISSRALWGGIGAIATLAACGAGLPHPTASDANRAAARWPGASVEDLGRGREAYVRTCAGCHALKSPSDVPPDQWVLEVKEMREHHGVSLTDPEADSMVRYLWTMGSRMRQEQGIEESARR
jgi:mono/diheme cytochrome c family protein